MNYDLITILGPTASGKTPLAAALAVQLHAEIISGDSRQVYRRMDLGTGKDLADYVVDGYRVPYHLIDIAEPGYKYNVFEFQRDFLKAYDDIRSRNILFSTHGLYPHRLSGCEFQETYAPLPADANNILLFR